MQSSIFEKKKMCVEMRNSYENLVEDIWAMEGRDIAEVTTFYNSERDTCLGGFRYFGGEGEYHYVWFKIQDFMNGNEDIFECGGNFGTDFRRSDECEKLWRNKMNELGK